MDVKVIRFISGLSQLNFANVAGLWQSRLSLIERGLLKPSRNEQQKIDDFVKFSGVDIDLVDYVERKRSVENVKHIENQ